MHIRFNRNLSLLQWVQHLSTCGWRFDFEGNLRCWQADSGTEDWVQLPVASLRSILSTYDRHRDDLTLSMCHIDDDEVLPISLGFPDPACLSLDCSVGRRLSPWHRTAIDFSWYLLRLLPDPETSNLQIVEIDIHSQHT